MSPTSSAQTARHDGPADDRKETRRGRERDGLVPEDDAEEHRENWRQVECERRSRRPDMVDKRVEERQRCAGAENSEQ